MRIRAYTLDVHVGHAPCWMYEKSRECEILSLANCKPLIREVAPIGEWIAGITPARMTMRLAYLMQVDERIRRTEYWKRYKTSRFDAIYKPTTNSKWLQLRNPWHSDEDCARDLSSDWVLLSKSFYVFANSYLESQKNPSGLELPEEFSQLARSGMRGYGHFIEVPDSFLPWIRTQPKLALADFRVLRDFHGNACGCCKEETTRVAKCD